MISYDPDIVFISAPPDRRQSEISSGLVGALALGFDYDDGIRTELEYRYAYADIDTITLAGCLIGCPETSSSSERFQTHLLFSNFYFDIDTGTALTPFIGGGVGGAFAVNDLGQRDAALAYQGRAGVSFEISEGFAVSTEYVFTRSNNFDFDVNDDDGGLLAASITGFSGDRYQSSSAMISFRRKF